MKLALGVPCFDQVQTDFALSLAGLSYMVGQSGIAFTMIAARGAQVADARNEIVERAIYKDCTHLLFLDSDMAFPPDTFSRLSIHAKPIVGCFGVQRRFPITRCGEPLDQWADTGLMEMKSMGMAVCLLNLEIFKKLKSPYFVWGDTSEDVGFCTKARDAGLKIWCDADLSKEIGHVGIHIYK